MVYVVVGLTLVLLLVFLYGYNYVTYKSYLKKVLNKVKQAYGKTSDREYSNDDLDNIKKFFESYKKENSIDDITSNDLDIDKIYMTFNVSNSAAGDDYFYYRLRTPDENVVAKEEKISFVDSNENSRNILFEFFYSIGRIRKISFLSFLSLISDGLYINVFKEYLSIILVVAAVLAFFVDTTVGIVSIIAVLVYNIITYYKQRGIIEPYIIGFSYITNLVGVSLKINNFKDTPLEDDVKVLKEDAKKLKKIVKFYGLLSTTRQTGAGNPFDLLMDYFRMIFHIDIIQFYHMYGLLQENIDLINKLYFEIGELESYINISSMRKSLQGYTTPKFVDESLVIAKELYHPLLSNPVKNDLEINNNMLITGSNASGKSTFLKSVAINIILGKTINTCCADSFTTGNFTVFSSMSLKDDISKGDSYFMAEIKAFKRILDYASEHSDEHIIAFTDELLRGTNTVERVAACTSILRSLSERNIFTFAATHDIELTDLLENCYSNYHFDEDFVNDDVIFNYKLKKGKATSKNAIKLLNVMGFGDNIVNSATKMADNFVNTGEWKLV